MSVTIRDVAKHAQVSVKTVSRVINNEIPVREMTRERVLRSINELGYVANIAAQRLARGRSHTIAFVYFNASWHYTNMVMRSVLDTAIRSGYSTLLCPLDSCQESACDSILRLAIQGSVDGFIFTPPADNALGLLAELESLGVPFVRLTPNDRQRPWPYVAATDRSGAREMTDYLLSLGHRRIGFIRGPLEQRAGAERFAGFTDTLAAQALALDPALVAYGDDQFGAGLACAETLLSVRPRPTAIFANNDEMASGVLAAAHQQGIAVPGELSVVGFDDAHLARQVWPPLTTVRQPVQEIARIATEVLMRLMQGEAAGDYRQEVPTELIIRDSAGPAPQTAALY